MRFILLSLAGCAVAQLCCAQTPTPVPPASPAVLVLRSAALIDGTGAAPRRNQEIVVTGNRITDVYPAGAHAAAGRRAADRPGRRDRAARADRLPYAHLPAGRGARRRRLRRAAAEVPGGVPRRARRGRRTPRARAGLHDDPRRGDRGRRLRRRRHQAGDRGGLHSRPAHAGRDARDLVDRRLPAGGLRAGDHGAEGRAADRRAGRGAQGGARAARPRRRLDQGLHDASLLGR